MSINRTTAYEKLRAAEAEQLNDLTWTYAPRWRSRVGLPRLTAGAAALEADGLLRSINPSTFRNQPEIREQLERAREVVSELARAIAQDNWRRFEGDADGR